MNTNQEPDAISTPIQARKVMRLLDQYAESHRNPRNEKIHFVCVPIIMWTVLALLWTVHPVLALTGTVLALFYYFSLSIGFAIGMSVMVLVMLSILWWMPQEAILRIALIAFVIAWIFQFIGHKIEGKKPSFFEDLQFLLIGPLFVIGFLYRRFNWTY